MNLVIIDYGLCNLRSVSNALKFLGIDSKVSHDSEDLLKADLAILPGVGAFEDGMKGLAKNNLVEPIHDFVQSQRPFLGICLGMQLLMSQSFEFGAHQGLDLIKGDVIRFNDESKHSQHYDFKVPHIGWNALQTTDQSWEDTILADLNPNDEMYFVHSYHVVPDNPEHILSETEYGHQTFCSVVNKDNVYGCQFHPEKSSQKGLTILKKFVEIANHTCAS